MLFFIKEIIQYINSKLCKFEYLLMFCFDEMKLLSLFFLIINNRVSEPGHNYFYQKCF